MKMMKKGNDTQYVPDVFVENFKKNGYAICGEEKNVAEPPKAPDVPPATLPDNSENDEQKNHDDTSDETVNVPPATPNANSDVTDDSDGNEDDETDAKVPDTDVHKCPHCDKEYAREGDLKNHIAKKHPAE